MTDSPVIKAGIFDLPLALIMADSTKKICKKSHPQMSIDRAFPAVAYSGVKNNINNSFE